MNISSTRENEEILRKLERILGTCSNIRENIESIISKDPDKYSESEMIEDMNVISHHLNTVMKSCDPIFNYYLVVPNNTENDECK